MTVGILAGLGLACKSGIATLLIGAARDDAGILAGLGLDCLSGIATPLIGAARDDAVDW